MAENDCKYTAQPNWEAECHRLHEQVHHLTLKNKELTETLIGMCKWLSTLNR